MKITKSGFYKIEEVKDKQIFIGDDLEVSIFDENNLLEKIEVGKNSKLNYFSYFKKDSGYSKHFITSGVGSEIYLHSLIFAKNNSLKVNLIGEVASSKSKIDINIVSISSDKSFIDLDGQIQINKDLKQAEGYLDQDNIFFGDDAKIRGLPTLLVRSDDVKASHACRIEKVSDEKLFYLRSRGIGKENALRMMIESYVVKTFGDLKQVDNVFYEEVLERILKDIN